MSLLDDLINPQPPSEPALASAPPIVEDRPFTLTLYEGDNRAVLRTFADNSIDAVVTDPPYELGFMGKKWDKSGIAYDVTLWREVLRVLKPGAHLLAFSGTRTYHRMTVAIEDAGFEIRDMLSWLYGCLDDQTECLTTRGWLHHSNLTSDDLVMQWNHQTGELNWIKPQKIIAYPFDGTLVHLKNRHIDQCLTDDHRVYARIRKHSRHPRSSHYEVVSAKDLDGRSSAWQVDLPLAGVLNEGVNVDPRYAYLVGWWLTDAWPHKDGKACMFSQCKPKTLGKLREVLVEFNTPSEYIRAGKLEHHADEHTFYFTGPVATRLLTEFPDRKMTWEFLQWSFDARMSLLEGLLDGDGSAPNLTQYGYVFWSQDPIRRGIVTALGLSLGWRCYEDSNNNCVYINPAKNTSQLQDKHRSMRVPYTGTVWCVAVPTGAFVVRRNGHPFITGNSGFPKSLNLGDGRGTALKPAQEPLVMARKPLVGTVAANVEQYGTGALNIDACRIGNEERVNLPAANKPGGNSLQMSLRGMPTDAEPTSAFGRWPANVVLDEDAAALLDEQSGETTGGTGVAVPTVRNGGNATNLSMSLGNTTSYADSGGASRFFYVSKPSRSERDYGIHDLEARSGGEATDRLDGSAGLNSPRAGAGRTGGSRNHHPTVKPVELMQWLVRLVTPPNGVCLDPFMGSGTTGMACAIEQRSFIGIDRDRDYVDIAQRRIAHVAPLFGTMTRHEAPPRAEAPPLEAALPDPEPPPTEALAQSSLALDAVTLWRELVDRGHTLHKNDTGDKLRIGNASLLTESDRQRLRTLREELLAMVPVAIEAPPPTTAPSVLPFVSLMDAVGTAPEPDYGWKAEAPIPLDDRFKDLVVNVETNGLNWANGDRPIGITVGTLDGEWKRYYPFAHLGGGNLDEAQVREWAQRELRDKHITNIHTKFDIHMLREWGTDLEEQGNTVSDISHYAALLDDHRKSFKLDVLAKDFLGGIEVPRLDESQLAFYHAAQAAPRAEYQATLVSQLRAKMWPELDAQDLQRVRQIEDDCIYPVVEMEKNGVLLDVELLETYFHECQHQHNRLMSEVIDEVGFQFEHTPTGWTKLFEYYKLPPSDSYAEDFMATVDHPVIQRAYLASQYASLNSKTFAAYRSKIDSKGVLRYDINQLKSDDGGTVSGRFSIPYIHQVPNGDNHSRTFGGALFPRRLFRAARGLVLSADAAQIEYRIFAHYANNPKVIAAYQEDPWMSFHKKVHAMVQPLAPFVTYTDQKRLDFLILYGGKTIKLAQTLGYITAADAAEIREQKAYDDPRLAKIQQIERAMRQELPEVEELLQLTAHLAAPRCDNWCNKSKISKRLHQQYQHRGYVRTITGRRARFPNGYGLHAAFNRADQGSGADIMKIKLAELHRQRRHTGLLLRATVHDEVFGDAQEPDTADKVREILNHQSIELRVPILWEVGTGETWADAK